MLIQLIADYGIGDPFLWEKSSKSLPFWIRFLKSTKPSVPAFSTLATGFWTAQFAFVNPTPGMMIYTNTAPRKDDKNGRHANEGERLKYALFG